jgi:hypothetical protein
MTVPVHEIIKGVVGKPCSRKEVGEWKSLSLGFGEIIPDASRPRNYAEWEFRIYHGSWRIVRNSAIVLGSRDLHSNAEFNRAIDSVKIGNFSALSHLTNLDVRIECDNNIAIDFLASTSHDDAVMCIFCPNHRYIEFKVKSGWKTGASNKPSLGKKIPF